MYGKESIQGRLALLPIYHWMPSIHIKITYKITTSKVQPKCFLHIQKWILHIRFSLIVCNQWQYEPGFDLEHTPLTLYSHLDGATWIQICTGY